MLVWQSDNIQWYLNINGKNIEFETQAEALMALRDAQYIESVKAANKKVWDGINDLIELQKEWNALDYGSTLVDTTGVLTAADIGAVVFDTANALVAVQNAGYATNMAKLL